MFPYISKERLAYTNPDTQVIVGGEPLGANRLQFRPNGQVYVTLEAPYSELGDQTAQDIFLKMFLQEGAENYITLVSPQENKSGPKSSPPELGTTTLNFLSRLAQAFPGRILNFREVFPQGGVQVPDGLKIYEATLEGRTIRHICFTGWPENGVLRNEEMQKLIDIIKYYQGSKSSALLVNCRLGVSRSGAVAVSYEANLMKMSLPVSYEMLHQARISQAFPPYLRPHAITAPWSRLAQSYVEELSERQLNPSLMQLDTCIKELEIQIGEFKKKLTLTEDPHTTACILHDYVITLKRYSRTFKRLTNKPNADIERKIISAENQLTPLISKAEKAWLAVNVKVIDNFMLSLGQARKGLEK